MKAAPNARSSLCPRPLPLFLIANPRLEFSLNSRKQTYLEISNRERMAISAVTRTATREQSRVAESTARRKGAFMTIPSEVQRRFFRELARASYAGAGPSFLRVN
jgi:hypothetical protein